MKYKIITLGSNFEDETLISENQEVTEIDQAFADKPLQEVPETAPEAVQDVQDSISESQHPAVAAAAPSSSPADDFDIERQDTVPEKSLVKDKLEELIEAKNYAGAVRYFNSQYFDVFKNLDHTLSNDAEEKSVIQLTKLLKALLLNLPPLDAKELISSICREGVGRERAIEGRFFILERIIRESTEIAFLGKALDFVIASKLDVFLPLIPQNLDSRSRDAVEFCRRVNTVYVNRYREAVADCFSGAAVKAFFERFHQNKDYKYAQFLQNLYLDGFIRDTDGLDELILTALIISIQRVSFNGFDKEALKVILDMINRKRGLNHKKLLVEFNLSRYDCVDPGNPVIKSIRQALAGKLGLHLGRCACCSVNSLGYKGPLYSTPNKVKY